MNKITTILAFLTLLLTGCSDNWKENELTKKSYPLASDWTFQQVGKQTKYPATVPGTVHTDLFDNKLIEDPFYRENEKKLQWIEEEDWTYETTFDAPENINDNNFALQFEGLDTYADVLLNGEKILSSDNMFVGYETDISSLIKQKGNTLKVYFHSPIKVTKPLRDQAGFEYPADNDARAEKFSIYSRKAPYSFGWDWGPRFVTSGIWRPINVIIWNKAKIEDIHIQQTSLNDALAELNTTVTIHAAKAGKAKVRLITDDEHFTSEVKEIELKEGENKVDLSSSITQPERWWPNGLGDQKRYNITTQVLIDGKLVDQQLNKVGLRTVELINEPDSLGESFYLKVNGQPVFMKGVNYIPQDSFLPSVTQDRYDWMIKSMLDAHMNMVRIWGGGIYESDYFYDQCDEKGLLVWQDFMFACTMYPGDKDFLRKVEEEATYNIKRLRNRPSLALWCGNNEVGVAWDNWGWQDSYGWSQEVQDKLTDDYDKLFNKLLPKVVGELDPNRFYYPSSPISNWGDIKDFSIGDNHYWGVWHGKNPFESFKEYVPRFMSEYGFQSFPSFESIKKFTIEEDWGLETDVMNTHQKSYTGNGLIKVYMERDFNVPKNFEDFVYVGMLLQADGMRQGFEAHRSNMPYCMGTLYWQLDDCWPAASWSSIDYYGEWKALHYSVQRSFRPQLIVTDLSDNKIEVKLVNDEWKEIPVTLEVEWKNFKGDVIAQKEVKTTLESNGVITSIDEKVSKYFGKIPSNSLKRGSYLYLKVKDQKGQLLTDNYAFFVKPKVQKLLPATVSTKVIKEGGQLIVEVSSDVFAESVALSIEGKEVIHFTDNYFHLQAGESRKIVVERTDFTAKDLEEKLLVKCLNNIK
ncbi:hypothetical protein KMW28_13425 [Flammeovirga yaeyamensis]|uniref:Beta-mannosidase B n=1 Tax=Flammeovirga yaeyamensis TaxID=367791 RepID=A0AAX1MZT4_9BACT|nr:glycoside hydrolase family 2 protein [Flammeovirga yaeyamensis]MBB3700893.1 beta-mannosidase [Flammeovirga yaeyamensis]NMF38001.1 glycoside hydrolase family 2 protein [Flammeovirga yaeyamensis]QWG00651.1 hypothetical protein KMW28_13425 [Flammeovirga yaeyamensis]